jgi:hypothetical protein
MKSSGKKITCGDFKAVRKILALTGIPGEWSKGEDHCQFRADNGAVLNYWKTKGTIYFQGPELPAAELKAMFLRRAVIIRER